MAAIWNGLTLALTLLAVSVRAQLQYRLSFILMTMGNLLIAATEFFAIWVMFTRFGNLRGWRLPEVAFLYGLVYIAFALAEGLGGGFDSFARQVREGSFDRVLLRPRRAALLVGAGLLRIKNLGRMIQGLIILIWAGQRLGLEWTAPRLLFSLAAIAGGTCIFYGLFVLQATLCFWTVESLEVINIVTYGGVETAQYPLAIYPRWMRRVFTYLIPLACVNYLPALAILDRGGLHGAARLGAYASPALGVLFLGLCLAAWSFGVRHYHSTGS